MSSKRARKHDTEPDEPATDTKRRKVLDEAASTDTAALDADDLSDDQQTKASLQVVEKIGDLFAAPAGSVLVHACNCQGSWGAGIAAGFKAKYPAAFSIYAEHCRAHKHLLGTSLLIAPQQQSELPAEQKADHWIGCLFTSEKKGKSKGSKESILEATEKSMRDLLKGIKTNSITGDVHMCKINAGLFRVEWSRTKAVLEGVKIDKDDVQKVQVVSTG